MSSTLPSVGILGAGSIVKVLLPFIRSAGKFLIFRKVTKYRPSTFYRPPHFSAQSNLMRSNPTLTR